MNAKKVCIASWAPFHAGAEVALERLAIGLQAAGHDVWIVLGVAGETLQRIRAAGIRCEHIPLAMTQKTRWWRYSRAQHMLRRRLSQQQPDIVHCNDLPTAQMVCQAAGQLGIPRICHHRYTFGSEAVDWMNKFGAERHLFVSKYLMDDLSAKSAKLAALPRAVVYDGLPLTNCPTQDHRALARKQLGLAADKVIVTFAGQIIERKGIADLLRGWVRLPDRSRELAQLVIVGDDLEGKGAYRQQMESLAAHLDCPAHFVGFQKNVPTWLTATDIAVVPSHVEPLGNATLEAMSFGLPVIGCRVGGIPEMIVHEETGVLVPPCSPGPLSHAIDWLVSDPETRRRLGAAARTRCEKMFSLSRHVETVLEQYDHVRAA